MTDKTNRNVNQEKRFISKKARILGVILLVCAIASGCGRAGTATDRGASDVPAVVSESQQDPATEQTEPSAQVSSLEDGVYTVDFDTDGSMFHVNEACGGKGTLTVAEGEMVLHISLPSKNVINLYPGSAEDAKKEGAVLLQPTLDEVTYSDGMTEEVHGFDIPVPVVGEEFDLALLGKKGTWYDHKVKVSNPVPVEGSGVTGAATGERSGSSMKALEDGEYLVDVILEGGSGRASVSSPAKLSVREGKLSVRIEWSSPHYDYMIVGGEKYTPVNKDGNSAFEFPISAMDEKIPVIADTTAMGSPHEVEYSLTFHPRTLVYDHRMELDHAEGFTADYFLGGYVMLTLADGERILVVPEQAEIPGNLDSGIMVLRQPVDHIYLVASAVMDMFVSLDALDRISLSGTKENSWYIEEARDAMAAGKIAYAGKYNMPDYERILDTKCSLAIESTMILHSPEVMEKLESFGIPVLIDRSSYESHPLGRAEWIKLYGALLGREKEAQAMYQKQKAAVDAIAGEERADKTVAFFFITSNGTVNVRKSGDYVPKMIELAGGTYIFSNLGDETASSSVNMTMEEFYAGAVDADFLIYNSTIDGELGSLDELLQKNPMLKKFSAVKAGNVFCTTQNFYQKSMDAGTFITDIHTMLRAEGNAEMSFHHLYRLKEGKL